MADESNRGDRAALLITVGAALMALFLLIGPDGVLRNWWSNFAERRTERQVVRASVGALDSLSQVVVGSNAKNKRVVYEFFDYECPFCLASEDSIKALFPPGEVELRRVEFPLSIHKNARRAAAAAICAARGGDGSRMHETLVADPAWIADTLFVVSAGKAKINDIDAFQSCLHSPSTSATIDRSIGLGAKLRINATPTFVSLRGRYVGLLSGSGAAEVR